MATNTHILPILWETQPPHRRPDLNTKDERLNAKKCETNPIFAPQICETNPISQAQPPKNTKRTQFRLAGRPDSAKRTQFAYTRCPPASCFHETNPISPRPQRPATPKKRNEPNLRAPNMQNEPNSPTQDRKMRNEPNLTPAAIWTRIVSCHATPLLMLHFVPPECFLHPERSACTAILLFWSYQFCLFYTMNPVFKAQNPVTPHTYSTYKRQAETGQARQCRSTPLGA